MLVENLIKYFLRRDVEVSFIFLIALSDKFPKVRKGFV